MIKSGSSVVNERTPTKLDPLPSPTFEDTSSEYHLHNPTVPTFYSPARVISEFPRVSKSPAMTSQSKISVYSVPDLKNTTDDALPNYLTSLHYKQDHRYTDVRLALGWTAVIIAGVLFYFDWKLGWDATKAYTLPAVVTYFILNGAFTYWMWFVEKGIVFAGEREGKKIVLSTSTKKHTGVYYLTARYTSSKEGSAWKEIKAEAPFTRWFTEDGVLVAKPFQQWLASEVPVIGEVDPANVVEEIGRGSEAGSSGAKVMNVDIGSLNDVLGAIQNQSKRSGKARRRG